MNVKGRKKKNQVVTANIFEQQELLKKAEIIRETSDNSDLQFHFCVLFNLYTNSKNLILFIKKNKKVERMINENETFVD